MFATTNTTITINGTSSDWESDEDLATTTGSYTDYITWDGSNLYFAIGGSDVDADNKVSYIYIDTDPQPTATDGTGTTSSIAWNITHTLPFTANYGFAYKVQSGDDYYNLRKYDSGWQADQTYNGSAAVGTNLLEVSIPWSNIGSPSQIYVVIFMQNDDGSWTWSGAPSNAFTDGNSARTFAHYLGYTITTGVSPDASGNVDASLPVELTLFNATPLKSAIKLNWITESEIDNLGFLLDRSLDPLSGFTTIADYRFVPELQGQGSVTYRTDYLYTDTEVVPGTKYYYILSDVTGNPEHGEPVTRHTDKMVNATPLWAESETGILKDFRLLKVYPNPFNPVASISYATDVDGNVQMDIIDMNGNVVKSLIKGYHSAGSYELDWVPDELSAGVYFCQTISAEHQVTRKIIYLK